MSRYDNDIKTSKKPGEIEKAVTEYLIKEGFNKKDDSWKKGMGIMIGPQWLKIEPKEGSVHIEAWTRFALLPGVYVGEMGIEGVLGAMPKRKLRQRVRAIEKLITS